MRRLSVLAVALVAVACASNNAQKTTSAATPGAGNKPNAQAVGVIPYATLHDAQRNRDVELSIEYPDNGGPFPLVIFSPGYGSSEQGYEQLVSDWTRSGYVVVRPRHADAGKTPDAVRAIFGEQPSQKEQRARSRRPSKEEIQKASVARDESERREMAKIWETQREPQWRDRVRDVTLIIDSLDAIEQRFPELKGKIDHAKIGVAGHSLGALTAMLVGGAKTFGNPPLSAGDPRVKAIIAMSPEGVTASLGLSPESFASINVPAMFMTGTEDRGAAPNEDWQWRKTAFTNAAAGDKYFVLLQGARHSVFAGTYFPVEIPQTTSMPVRDPSNPYPPGDPRNPNPNPYPVYEPQQRTGGQMNPQVGRGTFNDVRYLSRTFWDVYLKGEAKERDTLDKNTLGGVTIEKR